MLKKPNDFINATEPGRSDGKLASKLFNPEGLDRREDKREKSARQSECSRLR
jgi:hypothetical protein